MQTCKCRFRYGGFTGLVLAISAALSAVFSASLAAQSSSAGTVDSSFAPVTAPLAPVPPSVTPPAIEGTAAPQLTPSSDMHKVPARPELPRAPQPPAASQKMSFPQNPAVPRTLQQPSMPAQTGIPKTASGSSSQSSLSRVSKGAVRNTSLSAADIGTLSSLLGSGNLLSMQGLGGMFSISGMPDPLSGGASGNLMSGALAGVTGGQNQTAVLLQAVLEKLDDLQKTLESQNPGKDGAAGSDTKAVQDKGGQGGRILRFIAGNYNILPSCTAVFISRPEADGSFLLTGDRTYRASDKIYRETFYMLFKAAGAGTFNAAFSLSQQPENHQSLLYALTRAPFLQAVRTGNLVTMRVLTENVQTDLLLDIDFNSRGKDR